MCGICGIFAQPGSVRFDRADIRRMTETLSHRGPDAAGYYLDQGVGFGQRRLSIIDLDTGNQPMYNEDRSVAVVCNGEIYNYRRLKRELEAKGHAFRTDSDIEVIPHLYEEFGASFPSKMEGMFAVALWDAVNRRLLLSRDRAGIKPLFVYQRDGVVVFGSELKALRAFLGSKLSIDVNALFDYLSYAFIPGPKTIYCDCEKLGPGTSMAWTDREGPDIIRYWSIGPGPEDVPTDPQEVVDLVSSTLDSVVEEQLVSDVSFGCFLSGGIDSSLVAAKMSRYVSGKVNTFSIGFDHEDFNELDKARVVAEAIDADHHELVVTPDVGSLLDTIAYHYDEPFGDPSAIPTFLVSKLAAGSVKMCMSGDGGDELFAGYRRYQAALSTQWYDIIPSPLKRMLLGVSRLMKPGARGKVRLEQMGLYREARYANGLRVMAVDEKQHYLQPDFLQSLNGHDPRSSFTSRFLDQGDFVNEMGYVDMMTYLVDSNLQKVDRASMAASLEVRVPLLGRRMMELSRSIPGSMKMRNGELKWILKQVFARELPAELLRHPKQGFAVPIKYWFRHELRGLVDEMLSDRQAAVWEFVDPGFVYSMWQAHQHARRDYSRSLWALLMLDRWGRTHNAGRLTS